jgi:hypothetical protein
MKRLLYIIIGVFLLQGCSERQEYRAALFRAEAVMNDHPDSALLILDSLGQHEKEFGRHFRMQYLLHRTNAENKSFVKFTTDSVAKDLVEYFDSHGTVNEQVLSNYLLGMVYSDMGEAPKAINSFQNAIEAADTTVSGFNYGTLSCAYSQMATIYRRQLLLTNEIEARKKASYYAFRANQVQWALYDKAMSAGAYILLNKKDSAEIILKSALEQYRKYGFTQQALRYSNKLIYIYTQNPQRLAEAKALMDLFEAESNLFNNNELPPQQRQYYYYKGIYYESIHQLDSAEYYYRKVYFHGINNVGLDPMYRGLLSVFSKRHQADSIAKYAQLYCMANDSSIAIKDRDQIAQMAALYNYNSIQKEAYESEVKAYRRLIWLIVAVVLIIIFIVVAVITWRNNQRKIKNLKKEYADATEKYERNLHKLELLDTTHQKVIETIQQELNKAQGESSDFKDKYAAAQQTISRLSQDYEDEKAQLLEETEVLKKRINELKKNEAISKHVEDSEAFKSELIVSQILNLADKRLGPVKENYWAELTKVFGNNFPALFKDLHLHCNTPQNIRVCILTILDISNDEQAIMLDTTKQRVSNVKSALNKNLFNEPSSRTLRSNLVVRYNIYGLERNIKIKKE